LLWRTGSKLEVVLLERLDAWKSSRSRKQRSTALLPLPMFGLQKPFEEPLETQSLPSRLVGDVRQMRRHRSESEPAAKIANSPTVDHAISSASIWYMRGGCCSEPTSSGTLIGIFDSSVRNPAYGNGRARNVGRSRAKRSIGRSLSVA